VIDDRPCLTGREADVLAHMATYRTYAQIGDALFVSEDTVKSHALHIYQKLGVKKRSDSVERAIGMHLITAPPAPGSSSPAALLRSTAVDRTGTAQTRRSASDVRRNDSYPKSDLPLGE
jgi:DNA-binding CsgD family transcriptional regulator